MNLVSLENFLDNTSFLVLFLTMLVYWAGAAFPSIPLLPAWAAREWPSLTSVSPLYWGRAG